MLKIDMIAKIANEISDENNDDQVMILAIDAKNNRVLNMVKNMSSAEIAVNLKRAFEDEPAINNAIKLVFN